MKTPNPRTRMPLPSSTSIDSQTSEWSTPSWSHSPDGIITRSIVQSDVIHSVSKDISGDVVNCFLPSACHTTSTATCFSFTTRVPHEALLGVWPPMHIYLGKSQTERFSLGYTVQGGASPGRILHNHCSFYGREREVRGSLGQLSVRNSQQQQQKRTKPEKEKNI